MMYATSAAETGGSFTDRILSFSGTLAETESRSHVFDTLAGFVRGFGFSDVSLTIRTGLDPDRHAGAGWTTLADERAARLAEAGFDGTGPVHRFARRAQGPFAWSRQTWPGDQSPAATRMMAGLDRAGIEGGITTVAWGPGGAMTIVDAYGAVDMVAGIAPEVRDGLFLAATLVSRALDRKTASRARAGLTAREVETLQLSARGLNARAIASRMGIVEPTVKFHLGSARKKLNARNKAEAVVRFTILQAYAEGL